MESFERRGVCDLHSGCIQYQYDANDDKYVKRERKFSGLTDFSLIDDPFFWVLLLT